MRRCRVLHFSKRVINVAAVVLMISAYVNHRALEDLISPLHPARFDINVARENHYVCVAWGGIESTETEVQI
ncbi:hypothetical protein PFLU4_36000 [Pseudomonas fluorescens]|nr:hypothetical protein PFLU4_36000 [Pseudomonas fluorescens]